MAIGAVLYTLLQVVMLGAFEPKNLVKGWADPLGGVGDFGAWYTIALAVGAGWLAKVLIIDAVISPAGTGIVYVGTSARLSYAIGEEREMPRALARTNSRGVPVVSILVALVVGLIGFGPFKSWSALVSAVTGATAVMYAMAPIALAALHRSDGERPRSYRAPWPSFTLPAAFVSANLILYWGGLNTNLKVIGAIVLGLVLFVIGSVVKKTHAMSSFTNSWWLPVWLAGDLLLGWLGRYGDSASNRLPEGWDLIVVIAYSLGIFYLAVHLRLEPNGVSEEVAKDAHQLSDLDELNVAG
jgi:amino acid transporter